MRKWRDWESGWRDRLLGRGLARFRNSIWIGIVTIPAVTIERETLTGVLRQSQLFSDFSDQEVARLANRMVRRPFATGEVLFAEGDACRGLYLVVTGKVRIFKTSTGGREQVLAVEGPGATVAELPVFDGGPYPASSSAVEPTVIAFLSRRDLHDYCMENPEVALKMLAVVGARLRRLVGIIEELSFTTIRQRLIAFLLRLAETEGEATEAGVAFLLPGSHQELASQLGTVRELISRNLTRLQAEGLIEFQARQVILPSKDRLAAALE